MLGGPLARDPSAASAVAITSAFIQASHSFEFVAATVTDRDRFERRADILDERLGREAFAAASHRSRRGAPRGTVIGRIACSQMCDLMSDNLAPARDGSAQDPRAHFEPRRLAQDPGENRLRDRATESAISDDREREDLRRYRAGVDVDGLAKGLNGSKHAVSFLAVWPVVFRKLSPSLSVGASEIADSFRRIERKRKAKRSAFRGAIPVFFLLSLEGAPKFGGSAAPPRRREPPSVG